MVSHERGVCTPSAAGEFWRVQNHGIEFFALLDEPVERLKPIAAFEPDTWETVYLGVAAGPRNGGFAAVDAEHFGCSADGSGGHREAARIAEHVEHSPATEVFCPGQAVLAL